MVLLQYITVYPATPAQKSIPKIERVTEWCCSLLVLCLRVSSTTLGNIDKKFVFFQTEQWCSFLKIQVPVVWTGYFMVYLFGNAPKMRKHHFGVKLLENPPLWSSMHLWHTYEYVHFCSIYSLHVACMQYRQQEAIELKIHLQDALCYLDLYQCWLHFKQRRKVLI